MRRPADLCKECRLPEGDHHAFAAWKIPDGCMCDPREWFIAIPAPCASYTAEPDGMCSCEHLRECHKEAK